MSKIRLCSGHWQGRPRRKERAVQLHPSKSRPNTRSQRKPIKASQQQGTNFRTSVEGTKSVPVTSQD
eukprot:6235430-Prorocentrum_lima.AAC.1